MKTSKAILNELHSTMVAAYKKQLDGFGAPRSPAVKKERQALVDGFSDGVRSGMNQTCKMLGVEVVDEEKP